MDALDREIARVLREEWSPEARAASAAVRAGRATSTSKPAVKGVKKKRNPNADMERRIRHLDRTDRPEDEAEASRLRKQQAASRTGDPASTKAAAQAVASVGKSAKKRLPWEGGERPEAKPGHHELEAVRSAMQRDERDALDKSYSDAKKKGYKGRRTDYLHDVGNDYETKSESEFAAKHSKAYLYGESVSRLKKITKRKKAAIESALDREITQVVREVDARLRA